MSKNDGIEIDENELVLALAKAKGLSLVDAAANVKVARKMGQEALLDLITPDVHDVILKRRDDQLDSDGVRKGDTRVRTAIYQRGAQIAGENRELRKTGVHKIGAKAPGPLTQALREAYDADPSQFGH
jgi:hypothetical protein